MKNTSPSVPTPTTVEQTTIEKYYQDCVNQNKPCIYSHVVEIVRHSTTNTPSHSSPQQIALLYKKKINWSIKIQKKIQSLSDSMGKGRENDDNRRVYQIEQLLQLLRRLYSESQETVYQNGKSVRMKVLKELSITQEDIDNIETLYKRLI